jgi:hypothetical protein
LERLKFISPKLPRKLKYSLSSTLFRISNLEPFATFCASYLFSQSNFFFFQNFFSLIHTIHLNSQLYHNRTIFESANGILAPHSYWEEISNFAFEFFELIIKCISLLPCHVSKLMKFLKKNNIDIDLIFFECFINQILDNPAVVGYVPWNTIHHDWSPSRDISDAFRCKYMNLIKLKHIQKLKVVVSQFK